MYGVGARSLRRLLVLLLFSLALASVPMHAENAVATWSDDYIVVPYSGSRSKIDGMWSSVQEWADGNETIFRKDESFWVLRVKQVYADIYVLVEVVSDRSIDVRDGVYLGLSKGNASSPQLGDYLFYLSLGTKALVRTTFVGDGEDWKYSKASIDGFLCMAELSAGDSPYASDLHMTYEFKIPIGLFGAASEFRFYVEVHDGDFTFRWPENGLKSNPLSWGCLVGFQYPDPAVTKVWVGDANGSRDFPKPGEAFYVWATVENWGVSTYMKFGADVYLDEVRLARFESLSLKRWEVVNLSSQAGGVETGLHRLKWIVGDSKLLELDRKNNEMSYDFQVTDQIILVIQPCILSMRLLQNPGFESGKLSPWFGRGNVTVQSDVKYEGEYAVQLAPPVGEERVVGQPVLAACDRGQTLTVSAMMKADDNIAHSYIGFEYRGADGKVIGRVSRSSDFGGGYDWVERSFTAIVPFGAYFFDVIFWFESGSERMGCGYVDRVSLIHCRPWGGNLRFAVRIDGDLFEVDSSEFSAIVSSGSHNIEVEPTVNASSCVRFMFGGWADGDYSNSRILEVRKSGVLVVHYLPQYYLRVDANGGEVSGEGWYDEGSVANVTVKSPVRKAEAGVRLVFAGWSGDSNSTSKNVAMVIVAPSSVAANWKTQYFLEVVSPYSEVKGRGWYDQNSTANFSVNSTVSREYGVRYFFDKWSGDFEGISTEGSVVMDAPRKVVAVWKMNYMDLSMYLAMIGSILGLTAFGTCLYFRIVHHYSIKRILQSGLWVSFEFTLVTFLLLLLLKTVWPKVVPSYLDMNYFAATLIVIGLLTMFLRGERKEVPVSTTGVRIDYAIAFASGLAGGVMIWYAIQAIGWLSYLISILGGALIVLLSVTLLREESQK